MRQTRIFWFLMPVLAVLAMLLGGVVSKPALAAPVAMDDYTKSPLSAEPQAGGPPIVRVGVYVLSVGNLDVATGSYSMDFYLQFKCDNPCSPTSFDIMNASDFDAEDQTSDTRNGTFYTYRVKADLATDLNLLNYPFDQHQLAVVLEDKNLDTSQLVYEYDPALSGVDPEARAAGWDIREEYYGDVTSHKYPMFQGEYSRFRFYVTIFHPWFPSFMKGLFAAIVVVGVGMLSFLFGVKDGETRIALTSGTLASAIFYHLTLTASVPPIGYLTYADKFMILQYVFITAALGISIALFLMGNQEDSKDAARLHAWTRWSVPLLWVISMLALHHFTIGFGV